MSHMVVNKMGPPSRMLIRWVCPNQQMATFQTRETTNGTTRYLNHINKFADQQDGPTTHIVVSGPISLFLLSRKHKMGCANCIPHPVQALTLPLNCKKDFRRIMEFMRTFLMRTIPSVPEGLPDYTVAISVGR